MALKPILKGGLIFYVHKKGGITISNQDKEEVYTAALDLTNSVQSSRYHNQQSSAADSISSIKNIATNPQSWDNFSRLLSHVAYYVTFDSMCSGAIKNILVPFSSAPYRLVGSNKKTRQFYDRVLDLNNFEDVLNGIAMDYWVYGQAYLYVEDDYTFQLLPPFRCQVEAISVGGEPIVSYELDRDMGSRSQTDIEKILRKYKGHPDVVEKAIRKGDRFAQLEQEKLFRVAYSRSGWEKYAIPMLAPALPWLVQKDYLVDTELTELENMQRTFLQIKVGDEDRLPRPNSNELALAASAYINAIHSKGSVPAAVSWNVDAEWKQTNSREVLKSFADSISFINYNILAAISMSPQLAAGDEPPNKSGGSSYSATQASVSVINKRINAFLKDVEKMLDKIFKVIAVQEGFKTYPTIVFDVVDLGEGDEITDALYSLYDKGLISKESLLENTRFSYEEELEKRAHERDSGADDILLPPKQSFNMSADDDKKAGRPEMSPKDRKTDPNAINNDMPSPSDEKDYQ